MSGWTSIVLLNLFAFAAFDKVRCESLEDEMRAVVYTTVVECLSRKATSTVGKRLGAIRRSAEFCTARALPPFPLDDSCMHAYLLWLSSDSRARGSSGKSFLEAVRFTSSMLGLRSKELQLISQRVTGLADSLVKQAPVIEQAIALTVEQIKRTEMTCCNSESLQDRVLVGGILLMIYGSARASDMARAIKLLVDRDVRQLNEREANEPEGFIELAVLGNKGARSDVHRRLLLPVVAPMMSLSGGKWWDAFLEARMALGLETEGRLKWPLLCRFDSDGKPLEQNLTASDDRRAPAPMLGHQNREAQCCAQPLLQSHDTLMVGKIWYGAPCPQTGRAPPGCWGQERRDICSRQHGPGDAGCSSGDQCCDPGRFCTRCHQIGKIPEAPCERRSISQ